MFDTTEENERRITINHCRKVLGQHCSLTDAELEELRDQLYELAEVAVDAYLERKDDALDAADDGTESGGREYDNEDDEAIVASYNDAAEPTYSGEAEWRATA